MNGKLKYSIIAAVLLGILVYLESIAPHETNWTPTFSGNDKIPYGTWVLRHSLEDLFPGTNIEPINESFYQHWGKSGADSSNLIIITGDFEPDSLDLDILYQKAAKGADIFIASRQWPKSLTDSLKFSTNHLYGNLLDSVTTMQILTENGWSKKIQLKKLIQQVWFDLPDSTSITPLGTGNGKANYIKIPYGDGNFLLHSQPLAFTNDPILYNDNSYQELVLAWMANKTSKLEWDEYYKPYRIESSSPLKVLLSKKALRAAYWTLLIGLVLYVFTNIRRRQRAIPVLNAKANLSLEFVQTIGLLYHNRKDHKDLVQKIFAVYAEYVTSKYFIRIEFSPATYEKLALKSGVSRKIVTQLFERYEVLSKKEHVYEDELFRFNSLVEAFYQESQRVSTQNKKEQNS